MTFTRRILVGLTLGIATGVFFGDLVAPLGAVADGFVKLLQMTVLPYVTISIVSSLGSLTFENAKRLGVRVGGLLLGLWAIALLYACLMPLAFPSTMTASFFSTTLVSHPEPIDVVALYIPSNPFHSLANNIVPAVVLFSVILGVAVIGLERKQVLLDVLGVAGEAVARVTRFVVRLTPYGIFAIAATAAGTLDIQQIERIQIYLAVYIAVSLLLSLWVLPGLVAALTPIPYREVLAPTRDALITAFMAGDLFIVLPSLISGCRELLARYGITDEESASVPDVLVPTSFNFPHTGKLVSVSFVLFAAWFAGVPVGPAAYPQLALTGLLTFFGSLNVAVPFLLDMFRIPADTFQLFLATGVINSRFGSLLAAVHTVTIALVGTAAVVGAVRLVPARLVRYAVITVLLTAATLGGLRLAFEVLLSGEFKGREMIYGLKPRFDHPATVVLQEPLPPAVDRGPGSTIARIRSRGRLEVAVAERGLPYAFRNDSRELVGLDVEMAHRLARDLGVGIEFVQSRIDELPRLLRDGQCDIAMSGIAVTPRRAEAMRFSLAYLDETLGFMVLDHLQGRFTTWDAIRQQGGITIGAVNTPYYLDEVRDRAPEVRFEDISAVCRSNRERQHPRSVSGTGGARLRLDVAAPTVHRGRPAA